MVEQERDTMARTGQQLRQRTSKAILNSTRSSGRQAPRRRSTLGDRARYLFDNSMSRGTPALIAWLTVGTLLMTFFFALVVTVFRLRSAPPHTGRGFGHELFDTFLHALDPGYIGADTGPWGFLITSLLLTLAGLFVISALIGVIAAGIDEKLAQLRRGRSIVLESDHTVILGWSDSIFTILGELVLANESRKNAAVVILAERDKVQMEQDVHAKVPALRGTRVVCRSGSPIDLDDLQLVSHLTAHSVIVLSSDSDDPDAEVIKTMLALTHGSAGGVKIVAEIRNPSNLPAARLVGAEHALLLDIRETVAKLVAQTSRQSGAAAVYTELFNYIGDEFYFHEQHELQGRTYAEALQAYETASVVGLFQDDACTLNPPMDTVIDGHTLIVVTDDDSSLASLSSSRAAPTLTELGTELPSPPEPTQALMLGWNQRAPIVLRELDHYAPPGSSITVLTAFGDPQVPELAHLDVTVVRGSTTDRVALESHLTAAVDNVIVLCYSDDLGTQAADARTLISLLHVRDILKIHGVSTPVVSEMIDDRNRLLASVAEIDDIVVSGHIIGLLITQMSQDARLEKVFAELLSTTGAEIFLHPASWYVQPGEDVSFATIVAGAARRGESALGVASAALHEDGNGFGVSVNPAKSDTFTIGDQDRVVVLSSL